jgi:hypothetical protein
METIGPVGAIGEWQITVWLKHTREKMLEL